MFSSAFSLCNSWQDYAKITGLIFTKFGGKMACGPQKKLLDFVVMVVMEPSDTPDTGYVYPYSRSAALVEYGLC